MTAPERNQDPLIVYTVVRTSLGLGGGKIGAQCQHAFDYLLREVERLQSDHEFHVPEQLKIFRLWRETKTHTKIVLGASDEEFAQVKAAYKEHFLVVDFGYTQVAPMTETCLALWPMHKSARAPILQSLKPLK
jgi:peptidyl-tRNA hydrolase